MQWIMGTYPIVSQSCDCLIRESDGKAEIPLAQAITMRRQANLKPLLTRSQCAALDEWRLERLEREPTHIEQVIDRLARRADLNKPQEKLCNLNPVEFANSFRDADLHFLLAPKLAKLV